MSSKTSRPLMYIRRTCAAATIIFLVSGCFRVPRFTPDGVPHDRAASQALCENLTTAKRGKVETFRARLDTSVVTPLRETYDFRYAVVGREPYDFRIDLLPTEGAYTLGMLVVRENYALVIDSQARTYQRAASPQELFEKFFGIEGVTPDLVKGLVLGQVSGLMCQGAVVYRQSGGRLLVVDALNRHAWEVDEQSGAVYRVVLLDDVLERVRVEATRSYQPHDERVTIEMYKPAPSSAVMVIRKLTLNPVIDDNLFEVSPPADYDQG